jgi:hypothetical protein
VSLLDRRAIALRQKLAGLHAEFRRWRKLTRKGEQLEKHHSQVRALTAHLSGLLWEISALLRETMKDGEVLAEGRNVESMVLGLRRIWEFFRSKLAQRNEADMGRFLRAADELAWACYAPMFALCEDIERRQPPLVFLNGGLSPYALSRDQAFPAEPVPGEQLVGRSYERVLNKLPIPLIGVPWYQLTHLPDLPVVAHETGHVVEQDFGLLSFIHANLETALGNEHSRLPQWKAWSQEVFADLWGCLTLGPAYSSSLADFLVDDVQRIAEEMTGTADRYPNAYLRILLCAAALDAMGDFKDEGKDFEAAWRNQYPTHRMICYEADVAKVVEAILVKPLGRAGLDHALLKASGLRFKGQHWQDAKQAMDEAQQGYAPASATTILRWTAAARRLYDENPSAYALNAYGAVLIDYSKELIEAGTRAREGSEVGDKEAKETELARRRLRDIKAGRLQFEDFAAWIRWTPQSSQKAG